MMPTFKEEETLPTPKHLHGALTLLLTRVGVDFSLKVMAYLLPAADEEVPVLTGVSQLRSRRHPSVAPRLGSTDVPEQVEPT